jgi:DNA-binding transcriptional LysR family regulator
MARLDEIEIFINVFEHGSLTLAAHSLGMPIATVSRKLSSLEERLGTALIGRSTHKFTPTEAGLGFYEKVAHCYQGIRDAELDVRGVRRGPVGTIRVLMPYGIGLRLVEPWLLEFSQKYPQVSFAVLFDNQRRDPGEQGVDVAVRLGALQDSAMLFRRIGCLKLVLAAKSDYLRNHGEPANLNELIAHRLLTVARRPWGVTWTFEQSGQRIELPIRPAIAANDPLLIVDAVRGGFGIARIAQLLIELDLQSGDLRKVLPEWAPMGSVDITLLYPKRSMLDPKVRLFLDFLSNRFTAALAA